MLDISYSENFEIEDLGIMEIDVFDIEVEDNHNFFGNDILFHNSLLFSLHHLIDKTKNKKETYLKLSDHLNKTLDPFIVKNFKKYSQVNPYC